MCNIVSTFETEKFPSFMCKSMTFVYSFCVFVTNKLTKDYQKEIGNSSANFNYFMLGVTFN